MTSLKTQKAIKLSNSKAHKRIQNHPIFTALEWHTIKSMMPKIAFKGLKAPFYVILTTSNEYR